MGTPNLALAVEQINKSMLAGMQLAIVRWPRILTPQEVSQQADFDYSVIFAQSSQLASLLPQPLWQAHYTRGYAWQAEKLLTLWGIDNSRLKAEMAQKGSPDV